MRMHLQNAARQALCGFAVVLSVCPFARAEVKAWEEPIVIPTYEVGPPDPDPMFYAQESYQGAQKRIYPYPAQDQLGGEPRGVRIPLSRISRMTLAAA
jgi:hypothetical protein